MAIEARRMLS